MQALTKSASLAAVEAAVDLAEAAHADHLLDVQLGEADVRRVEAPQLLLQSKWRPF